MGTKQRIGFIGLGNVGASLAGNLLRHGVDLTVRDLNEQAVADFVARGARQASSPRAMAESCDIVITCLPSPAISAAVVEGPDGLLEGLSPGKLWLEMSTTDASAAPSSRQLDVRLGGHPGQQVADCVHGA